MFEFDENAHIKGLRRMTPNTEQSFLSALYERLWQSITHPYNPAWQEAVDGTAILVHLSKHIVLDVADFADLITPNNPRGSLGPTELLSRMIDVIPEIRADYIPGPERVSTLYRQLLNRVTNAGSAIDREAEDTYNRARAFLYSAIDVQDATGKAVSLPIPSEIAQAYERNRLFYIQAVSNYQTAYQNYDLNDIQQQREWLANAPLLELAVTQAYNRWRQGGAAQVEQARAALATSKNAEIKTAVGHTLQNVLADAMSILTSSALPSVHNHEDLWYLAYALPVDWATDSGHSNCAYLNLSSTVRHENENLNFKNLNGGQSWLEGLWSVEDATAQNGNPIHNHVETDTFSISARIGLVRFYRPWFNQLALKTARQFALALDEESTAASLLIPTAFVTARDVQIRGDFSAKDREHLEASYSHSKNVGFGPFRLSGRYSHGLSAQTFRSTEDNGTITVPGLHVLAWISEVVPPAKAASAYEQNDAE